MAGEADLSGKIPREIVVVGNAPIMGANVTTFWVFRPVGDDAILLLKVVGHTLNIRNSRHRGYRDIEVVSATADAFTRLVFQWDGTKYFRSSVEQKPI